MRCKVLGDGREVLHECESWLDLIRWFENYIRDGDSGGWVWFDLYKDDRICSKYMVVK